MKLFRFLIFIWAFFLVISLPGCGHEDKEQHGHSHDDRDAESPKDEHGHDHEEASSGASFKPGKGVFLSDETRQILGIETASVTAEKLPQVIRCNVQVYGDVHRFANVDLEHTGCDVHGSGFLAPDKAALVEPNQPINLLTTNNEVLEGFVIAVQKTPSLGEAEVVVGVTNSGTKLKDGEFVTVEITLSRDEAVTVIPKTAVLRTAEGAFVYMVNGPAYYRKTIKTGSEAGDKIEIIDGLSPGDLVVTKPIETLWLIELRATKGGGHSH